MFVTEHQNAPSLCESKAITTKWMPAVADSGQPFLCEGVRPVEQLSIHILSVFLDPTNMDTDRLASWKTVFIHKPSLLEGG